MRYVAEFIYSHFGFMVPYIRIVDILQIFLITVLIYNMILWIRNTKGWNLLKGILFLLFFYVVASIMDMNVVIWIVNHSLSVLIMIFVIVFQPELRQVLDKLGSNMSGKNGILTHLLPIEFDKKEETEGFDKEAVMEVLNATFAMAAVKTGALIVIQKTNPLKDYVQRWGTDIDAIIGSELLINIFEKDTPLHDGAVIIIGKRIAAAKCFLPLNEMDNISAHLGTRHHAAAGISEVTDSVTVIVSEQTGRVSVAKGGEIYTNLDRKKLEKELLMLCPDHEDNAVETKKFSWKERIQRGSGKLKKN